MLLTLTLFFLFGCTEIKNEMLLKTGNEPMFLLSTSDNMQGLTFYNDHFYVGFDVGKGSGVIRKYTTAGEEVGMSQPLQIGHSAELAYRKANGKIYVANGGGATPTKIFEVDFDADKVLNVLDFTHLGNAGLVAIDNKNDLLLLHTSKDNLDIINFHVSTFDGEVIEAFSIPNQGVPQGLDIQGEEIYYYTNDLVTVMDFDGDILRQINVEKDGESEGLTIAGKYVVYGYSGSNRLYAKKISDFQE